MAGIGPLSQDGEPVVIQEKAPTPAAEEDLIAFNPGDRFNLGVPQASLYRALTGNYVSLRELTLRNRLLDAAYKAASSSTSLNTKKLDEETEKLHQERVLKAFMQTRMGKMVARAQMAELHFRDLPLNWEPVVIREKAPTAAAKKDENAVNAAHRSGADIETVKKFNAATNKAASSSTSLNTKKLDEETENFHRGF